ncbi:MAG: MCE family protein [Desulfobacteraceae bacterium]|nr:MCE family protein [Desulfobacteraceae bacterium]
MREEQKKQMHSSQAAEAVIQTRRSISIVWIVPVVALIIGGWLVYKAISEKGPVITISFKTAEGLEAGKTKIKYKDVEIGLVDTISLSKNLSHVVLAANLIKGAERYLTDQTKFWVVRARLTASEVSGLTTLFGGAYIAIDPGKEGLAQTAFKGLERAPVVMTDLPGKHFLLKAEKLGSLDIGSPVYYRQIQVGQVSDYKLDEDGQHVTLNIFINEPHNRLIFKNSRFWNASGMDITMDSSGIKIDTQSIVSMMIGGIAFNTPVNLESVESAAENEVFVLYENQLAAQEETFQIKHYWVLNFEGSVRGLSPGAPVEFKGIPIGKVLDINPRFDMDLAGAKFSIPVLIETEPERYLNMDKIKTGEDKQRLVNSLVAKGLRAQLQTGNLLTGQLFVDMDFHPDTDVQKIDWSGKYPVMPTVQQPLEELSDMVSGLIARIETIPFEQMGSDVQAIIQNLNESTLLTKDLLQQFKAEVGPEALSTLVQANKTLAAMEDMLSPDSPLSREATRTLEELSGAARSMRVFMDYLERHPDALIYGKGEEK